MSVYDPKTDSLIFVGGANVSAQHHRYQILVVYKMGTNEFAKVRLPIIVGGNARICLESDSDSKII